MLRYPRNPGWVIRAVRNREKEVFIIEEDSPNGEVSHDQRGRRTIPRLDPQLREDSAQPSLVREKHLSLIHLEAPGAQLEPDGSQCSVYESKSQAAASAVAKVRAQGFVGLLQLRFETAPCPEIEAAVNARALPVLEPHRVGLTHLVHSQDPVHPGVRPAGALDYRRRRTTRPGQKAIGARADWVPVLPDVPLLDAPLNNPRK